MLRVGLTGGIGAGKSTVAGRLAEHGAVVIDADKIAREVVEPGTEGLAELVAEFGRDILAADGTLDRGVLAARAFAGDEARNKLNAIVHPKIGKRTAELVDQAAPEAVVVHDVPLLVENGLAPMYHLVIVVDAPEDVRVARLTGQRGMSEVDARNRIAAQADEGRRRAVADVWLDNATTPDVVLAEVDALWADRLVPYEANVRLHRYPDRGSPKIVDYDPAWPQQARRVKARLRLAAGAGALSVDHIGSTSVPGLGAKDVLDFQITVNSLDDADAMADALGKAGFPVLPDFVQDSPRPVDPDPAHWRKRTHAGADPGRWVNVHLREQGSAGWRYALLFPAWLRADDAARDEYGQLKRGLAKEHVGRSIPEYGNAKDDWFDQAYHRAERWASETGWTPSSA
jgi:dephospho-CoA kinase